MKQLIVNYDPDSDFCELYHPYSKRFVTYVSQGVKPLSLRRFDQDSRRWWVHHSKLPQVIAVGKRYFEHVDYRTLPSDLQIKIVQFLNNASTTVRRPTGRRSSHEVLFVTANAPPEVVRAAYRALAQKYHPDHGGDPAKFREIDEAYKRLKQ